MSPCSCTYPGMGRRDISPVEEAQGQVKPLTGDLGWLKQVVPEVLVPACVQGQQRGCDSATEVTSGERDVGGGR